MTVCYDANNGIIQLIPINENHCDGCFGTLPDAGK
jgi:hypothetical protein